MEHSLPNGGHLKVIEGSKKPAVNKTEIWRRIFINLLFAGDLTDKKIIVAGVNYLGGLTAQEIHGHRNDRGWLEHKFCAHRIIVKLMENSVTPAEFAVLFPPTKTYDGARFECKDYFTAVETLHSRSIVNDEFLWEYWNAKTNRFAINGVMLADALRGYSCLDEFLDAHADIKPRRLISINGHFFDEDGQYIGKAAKKRRPKWLRCIQGGKEP